jgi:predicted transcriptional regulator
LTVSTTSLKLPEELKQRAVAAAHKQGVTPHAFMVEAIRQAASAAEVRAQFVADAEAARKDMLKSGTGYDADEVHAYLRQRIAGNRSGRPKEKAWRS